MMSLLILLLTTCLLHVEAAPDVAAWDLWPLVTPVLGSISAECYEASLEYISLLNSSIHKLGAGAGMSEEEVTAWRRFDANGPIPFLQEGLLQDGQDVNICDVLPGDISDRCNSLLDEEERLLSVPFGNAAGPGMETQCRKLGGSKYCYNYLSLFGYKSDDPDMSFGHTFHDKYPFEKIKGVEKPPVLRNELEGRNGFDPKTLVKLSSILTDQHSSFAKLHSSLTDLLVDSNVLEEEDPSTVRRILLGVYISLWLGINFRNGPAIAMNAGPYQGMCYPDACSKQDIQTNNLLFFNESVYKYINNGAVVVAFSPLLPEYIDEDTGGCSDDTKFRGEWRAENYIVITLLAAIGFLVIVGTAADILRRSDEERDSLKTNRAGLGFQMLTSFSVVSNLEFIFQSPAKKGSNRLDCFDGLRALSMTWVILGHNFLYGGVLLHGRNQKYRYSFYYDEIEGGPGLAFEPIFSDFSVDTFLFLGASLLSYLLLRDLDRSGGWLHARGPPRVLLFYLNRYLGITVHLCYII